MLQRQIERPKFTPTDRTILAMLSRALDRPGLTRVMLIVKPATVIGWHRRLSSTAWKILKAKGIDQASQRSDVTWSEFLRSQAAVACDFFTVDTALLRRYYVLLFIHIPTRQVFYAGTTTNPTGPWTTQAARNLFLVHRDRLADARALVRDRGSQFIDAFDEIFHTEGLKILKTHIRGACSRVPLAVGRLLMVSPIGYLTDQLRCGDGARRLRNPWPATCQAQPGIESPPASRVVTANHRRRCDQLWRSPPMIAANKHALWGLPVDWRCLPRSSGAATLP